MNKILDISDIKSEPVGGNHKFPSTHSIDQDLFKLTLNLIASSNPGKVLFTYDEAGEKLNVGTRFIARRVQAGTINVIYIGDKPMIHITEIARISLQGV